MPNLSLNALLKSLPDKPGIDQFLDADGVIIYIGKAKNLKKRVTSYFNRDSQMTGKLLVLVKKITDIRHTVTNTELDARLLENNLIKEHQPRYNIQLKDDKTFPWICIKKEAFPRVFPTRNVVHDGSEYYGPYASVKLMNVLLELIRQLYPLRTCKLNLTPSNIAKKKFRVCLQYHIGNCKGPCVGYQSQEDYDAAIGEIRQIIRGNTHQVILRLKELMQEYSSSMEFEKAHIVKEKLELLEGYRSKSTIVNPKISNVDVFSYVDDDRSAYLNYLKVVNGAIVQVHTVEVKKKLDEAPADILAHVITGLRLRFGSDSPEIIVPFDPEMDLPGVDFLIPQRGDKKELLDLSQRNATYYRLEKMKQLQLVDPERHSKRVMEQLRKDLRMQELPVHIECFDNSNIQGKHPVAAMVCFRNAKPDKKEYRHFNIRTVEGPDDFASMEEIVYRRYKRLLEENIPLPQLIVIDGGKGQLNAAMKSLEKLNLRGKITLIGIAKKLEEIYFPNDPYPIYLNKTSESLKIIQHLRDEAHRFGITHHRKKRQKETLTTELTSIPGIGPVIAEKLLREFKSVKRIREANPEEIASIIGKAKAEAVVKALKK